MVTTHSNRRADPASATLSGPGGPGRGVKAKVAVGLAVLGCAAGLALGGLRVGDTAPAQPVAAPAAIQAPAVDQHEHQKFLEQNRWLPDIAPPATAVPLARQRFLDLNTNLPAGPAQSVAQQRFLELNTVLPTGPEPPIAPGKPR